MNINQRGFVNIALITVLIVVLAGGVGYLVLNNKLVTPTLVPDTEEQTASSLEHSPTSPSNLSMSGSQLRPLSKSELKNFSDNPQLIPKLESWWSNIDFSEEIIGDLLMSIRDFDRIQNHLVVRDCAEDANDAMTRIKQYLGAIGVSQFSNFKVAEDTGTYFAIEYQVRGQLLKLYLINCDYITVAHQALDFNTKPIKIANIPHKITEIEAKKYVAFLQKLRAGTGRVVAQQIKQNNGVIKADISRLVSSGGDWGLCGSEENIIDHYEISVNTGDVIYWLEQGNRITGECHASPIINDTD